MDIISQFRGPYDFLSNFSTSHFSAGMGLNFFCVEQAFQREKAARLRDEKITEAIEKAATAGETKRLGRAAKNLSGKPFEEVWSPEIKVGVMRWALKEKFLQNPDLKVRLLATAPHFLMEGNTWKDEFWGVDLNSHKGLNWLGLLLMELRNKLQES